MARCQRGAGAKPPDQISEEAAARVTAGNGHGGLDNDRAANASDVLSPLWNATMSGAHHAPN
eukprot:3664722-Lingulodinium_polyedra.AAC.1